MIYTAASHTGELYCFGYSYVMRFCCPSLCRLWFTPILKAGHLNSDCLVQMLMQGLSKAYDAYDEVQLSNETDVDPLTNCDLCQLVLQVFILTGAGWRSAAPSLRRY